MDLAYAVVPAAAWLTAGSSKFLINSLKERRLAFDLIGYGGMPSTHMAIVSSVATLVGLREGPGHPAFGVALALLLIVMMDARSLRGQIGRQARAINQLTKTKQEQPLRERIGHSSAEIFSGIAVGGATAWLVDRAFAFFV